MKKAPALAVMALLVLTACVVDKPSMPASPPVSGGKCDPTGLTGFVGDVATERFTGMKANSETGAAMLTATGARVLRWVPPGTAVTMDYSEERLTVSYDENLMIIRATCG